MNNKSDHYDVIVIDSGFGGKLYPFDDLYEGYPLSGELLTETMLMSQCDGSDPALTDEALVAAAKLGNHAAFGELWKRYSNLVFVMVSPITGNRDDAEDAIQDAWMKAFTHLKTFHGRAKFSTWLTRIAINSALTILRKKRSHPEDSMDWSFDSESSEQGEVKDKRANIEEHYARKEAKRDLQQAIDRLTPVLRTVIEIQQSQDASVKEIANLAGISVSAAKSRLMRARSVLRRSLQSSPRTGAREAI